MKTTQICFLFFSPPHTTSDFTHVCVCVCVSRVRVSPPHRLGRSSCRRSRRRWSWWHSRACSAAGCGCARPCRRPLPRLQTGRREDGKKKRRYTQLISATRRYQTGTCPCRQQSAFICKYNPPPPTPPPPPPPPPPLPGGCCNTA